MIHCKYDELVDVKKLKPYPKNRNKHSPEQITRLAKILKYQGIRAPIVVSKRSGYIVKGHGTLSAIKECGWDKAPVVTQDFEDEDQEYLFVQSDNSIAAWAELDLAGINVDLGELGPFDIDLLGIKDFEVEPLDKYGDKDADDVPETRKTDIKIGDLFSLGDHRLLCGDSTDKAQVERLMNSEKADLWLTDPPYGVSYKSNGRPGKHREIENDSMPLNEMKDFWQVAATNAINNCSDEAAYYWFACQGGDQMMMMMMMAISDSGWKVRHELIWNKDSMVMGRCDYHYKHEPILYGWKLKGKHHWHSDRCQVSVLDFPRPKKSEEHPTMKPVDLVQYLIGNNTTSGQSVLDTFCGSGTTLIACEKTNRKCYGMEIDPQYCQVIIDRWEKFSGKKAEKIG